MKNEIKAQRFNDCINLTDELNQLIQILNKIDDKTEIDPNLINMIEDTNNRIFATIEHINEFVSLEKMNTYLINQRTQKKKKIEKLTGIKE